ncbi:hypothetical protein OJ996_23190 [Luteolibacter sp. GHJ8]|uniref:Uncharacterized protein n=1 Tax=Luteolibacter rhizosphaerae TaxID=2989719 RepID=A0ABT3G9I8_9BACT|nr:hypothetical protein [Luteolibacter rhizosphaerae]MCW1916511.1 hypothetical protein [Luteolibacter rhizosphaerae]
MSATITKKVTKEKLAKILPRAYTDRWGSVNVPEPITVIVFDDSVVKSGTLRKALHRVGDSLESLVLVGGDFTDESRAIASEIRAFLLAQSCYGWTDESYQQIRKIIGSKVKTPDLRRDA